MAEWNMDCLQDLMCGLEVVMALFTSNWFLILVESIWAVLTGFKFLLGRGF